MESASCAQPKCCEFVLERGCAILGQREETCNIGFFVSACLLYKSKVLFIPNLQLLDSLLTSLGERPKFMELSLALKSWNSFIYVRTPERTRQSWWKSVNHAPWGQSDEPHSDFVQHCVYYVGTAEQVAQVEIVACFCGIIRTSWETLNVICSNTQSMVSIREGKSVLVLFLQRNQA